MVEVMFGEPDGIPIILIAVHCDFPYLLYQLGIGTMIPVGHVRKVAEFHTALTLSIISVQPILMTFAKHGKGEKSRGMRNIVVTPKFRGRVQPGNGCLGYAIAMDFRLANPPL
jgi:hypothetical protein